MLVAQPTMFKLNQIKKHIFKGILVKTEISTSISKWEITFTYSYYHKDKTSVQISWLTTINKNSEIPQHKQEQKSHGDDSLLSATGLQIGKTTAESKYRHNRWTWTLSLRKTHTLKKENLPYSRIWWQKYGVKV